MSASKKTGRALFQNEPRALKREVRNATHRVLSSGQFILGSELEAFENAWSTYTGSEFTVGVGNGHDAIQLGLRALGIGAGDEVVTTAITAFATVQAIYNVGATPVIADIDPETALVSIDSVREKITSRTRAMVFVHLYGRAGDMELWVEFAESRGLYLIEDCAQAHGARFNQKHVGTFGVFGAFSFYPTKNLGGIGDAGALVTSDPSLYETVVKLRNYGQKNRYEHLVWGFNSRLDEIQAAVLRARLGWLEETNERRRAIEALLRDSLSGTTRIRLLSDVPDPRQHVHHLFVVTTPNRDAIRQELLSKGIKTLIHYPIPSHLQSPFLSSSGLVNLPAAEKHARECLSIMVDPWSTRRELARVSEQLKSL